MFSCLVLKVGQLIPHLDIPSSILKRTNAKIGTRKLRLGENFISPLSSIIDRAAIQIILKYLRYFVDAIGIQWISRLRQSLTIAS